MSIKNRVEKIEAIIGKDYSREELIKFIRIFGKLMLSIPSVGIGGTQSDEPPEIIPELKNFGETMVDISDDEIAWFQKMSEKIIGQKIVIFRN